jgi:adenylate cyclase
MNAKLLYRLGGKEKEIACSALMTIGRVSSNEVVVPHPSVSRNHAMIRLLRPGEYYLIDVGSSNGTYLNGKRVATPTLLEDADVITVADCSLTFRIQCGAGAVKPKKQKRGDTTLLLACDDSQPEEITLLVCDIRNYTQLSEHITARKLAAVMATWFKLVTEAVERCGGTVDKFIGDAVLARWASKVRVQSPVSVINAMKAAAAIDAVCAQVNAQFGNLPTAFRVGAGVNTGRAVLGNLGSGGYREYTVIGDAVNLTFRFESESKALGKDVVVGPDSYTYLPRRLWEPNLQSVSIKGRSESVRVWALTFDALNAILQNEFTGTPGKR